MRYHLAGLLHRLARRIDHTSGVDVTDKTVNGIRTVRVVIFPGHVLVGNFLVGAEPDRPPDHV